ncbi:hypothetical protein GCM10023153_31390 [Ornithinibacter aureus]|uniref:DUF4231 domain-containing protein n=1 Tax=Ornithinibacter aureus TaxID=622664 RepID=A0ABP8K9J0_9MICO|nr:S-4TM family putative pore-forming effector [Ornithinibacter aureus]KAF0833902.1 hypothetical protein C8E84_1705 [Ornithinibacter aureus]
MSSPYLVNLSQPTGIPPAPLHLRQLETDEVSLQRAAAVVHRRTQWFATAQETGAVVLAIVGMVSAYTGKWQGPVTLSGFAWFLVSAFVLGALAKASTEEAATIQEVFDCRLFALPWNETLGSSQRVTPDRMLQLAGSLKPTSGAEQRIQEGWYDNTDRVHYPLDVFISQEQNLNWDVRLRRRFRRFLILTGLCWVSLGVLVAVLADAKVAQTLMVAFVPAAAAFDLGRERWRVQQQVMDERSRLVLLVTDVLAHAQSGAIHQAELTRLMVLARQVQDGIFRTRSQFGRVPGPVYAMFKNRDEAQMQDLAEEHRARLAAPAAPLSPTGASNP